MKTFVSKLQVIHLVWLVVSTNYNYTHVIMQSKYANVPLHLEEIAEKLRQLDKPTITRQEVKVICTICDGHDTYICMYVPF